MDHISRIIELLELVMTKGDKSGRFETPGGENFNCMINGTKDAIGIPFSNITAIVKEAEIQGWVVSSSSGCGHSITAKGQQLIDFKKHQLDYLQKAASKSKNQTSPDKYFQSLLHDFRKQFSFVNENCSEDELVGFLISQIATVEGKGRFILEALDRKELAKVTMIQ